VAVLVSGLEVVKCRPNAILSVEADSFSAGMEAVPFGLEVVEMLAVSTCPPGATSTGVSLLGVAAL
jgi:hypothetical protein